MKEEKNKAIQIEEKNFTAWTPTYMWFAKTAGIILASLIVIFFTLNILLKPYMRQIPIEITPWLASGEEKTDIDDKNGGKVL
ncbi:MAG: hypothetical protein LBO62_07870 [Endomicrobium sp.]|jgi:hypothetical protein|nr:hypothetical protein [Endomicrobium sp.]